jgi:hypothetical protein
MVTMATKRVLAIMVSFAGGQLLPPWFERMSALLSEYASAQALATEAVEAH